jgi:ribonuclease HI
MIMCGCWAIWKERNARKHGESRRSVTESVRWVLETTIDLARTGKEKAKKSPKTKARWLPPAAGFLKINTDASFMDDTLSGSTGLVIRNHQGNLVYAQAIWYEHAASARSVEALAIRDAIRLATDKSYNQIIVESDSTEAVNMCAGDEQVRSELLPIFQEIRELKRAFTSCSISFIGREANQAAHLCAKKARSDRRRCLWINFNPSFLASTLISDCNPTR